MNKYFQRSPWQVFAAPLLFVMCLPANAQESQPSKQQPDDVIRVSTTLVQTDAMVFDKQGKFVEGIKPEQFVLKVNGQQIPVSFLELVTTGSAEEKTQLEAARRAQPATAMGDKQPTTITPPPGRSVFIFLDDLHLDADSLSRTRKMLLNVIDKELTGNDRALVTAASGQLGPQRLTTDKEALKAVVARLAARASNPNSIERPPMSEYAAVAINRGDQMTLDYYAVQILKFETFGASREFAEATVKNRARMIIDQGAAVASLTLTGLESFVREITPVPGRKLLFFLSDGFVVENERSISYDRLRSTARQAARAGVVIYSLNTRGLVTAGPDASDGGSFDPRLTRTAFSADVADQDVLYTLAADSGGRAVVNTNDLSSGIRRALEETSKYYLLAWRPPAEMASGENVKKIELAVAGRPELKVQTRRMLAEAVSQTLMASNAPPSEAVALSRKPLGPTINSEQLTALTASPQSGIPTSMVVVYRNVGGSNALTASLQLPTSGLSFAEAGTKQAATVEVAGTVLDQGGKQVNSFTRTVVIPADAEAIDPTRNLLFYNYDVNLPPGKYEVRLGVRDAKSRLIGSATKSIEIPDIASGKLLLSSLLLNEQPEDADEDTLAEKNEEQKGLGQRFAVGSRLQFLTYIYNAKVLTANDNEPDLSIEVKILRGGQPVSPPALRELIVENPASGKSYPYAAEVPLRGLLPGEYVLQLTVTDVTAKTTAVQRTTFVVDKP